MPKLPEVDEIRASQFLYAICGLAVAAGVLLAVWGWISSPTYWYDEIFALVVARGLLESPSSIVAGLVLPDVHPPLYYFLLAAWVVLFGDGEMAARGLSLLASLGALGLFWWMGRPMLSRPALALSLLWLSTHWIWVIYAAELRMYGPLLCGGAWMSLAFARLWAAGRDLRPGSMWLFCLLGLAVAFLHYSGMALFCSALLLLLLRHRRRPPLWSPALATGFLCVAWTAHHLSQVLAGDWIAVALGDGNPAWALPKALWQMFLPHGPMWEVQLSGPRILAWAALFSVYALALGVCWRQVRNLDGWRRRLADADEGDRDCLCSQLLLLGIFFLAMAAVHLWKPLLIHKALVAVLAPLAACVGCLGAGVFARRHLALAGLALMLATVSAVTAFHGQEHQWFHHSPFDRAGVREIVTRQAAGTADMRVFTFYPVENEATFPIRGRDLALLGGTTREFLRPVALRAYPALADARHFVPPFYFANVLERRGHFFRDLGMDVEFLSVRAPDGPGHSPAFTSFLVTESAP